jgi:hypothetical protein
MKKIIVASLLAVIFKTGFAQVKLTYANKFQIGYNVYTPIFIGSYASQGVNNGRWALEYYEAAGGLNFWKPWPNPNSGDGFLFLKDNGNVGVGMTNPSYKLDVNGIIRANNVSVSSDERLKTNIVPLKESINKLILLNAKIYNKSLLVNSPISGYTEKDSIKLLSNKPNPETQLGATDNKEFGFIAQELQKVYPELVSQDNEGIYSVNYIGLIPVLVEAIKEQQAQINILSKEQLLQKTCFVGKTSVNPTPNNGVVDNNSYLLQNSPNPFTNETVIIMFVKENSQNASLRIYDLQGIEIKSFTINGTGEKTIKLNANELKAGMYLYSLIIDGNKIDTKRMILTK